MQAITFIIYFGLGIFQVAAIMAGLEDWVGLHWIVAFPVAFLIAYFPLVGTIIGMLGAVSAWGWMWLGAFLLFFGPFFFMIAFALVAGGASAILDRRST